MLAHRFAGTVDPRHFENGLQKSLANYEGPTPTPSCFRVSCTVASPGCLREVLPEHVLEDAWEGEGLLLSVLDEKLPKVEGKFSYGDRGRVGRYVRGAAM